jgi:transposase InsO family protein
VLVEGAIFAFLAKLLLVPRSRLKSRASLEAENLVLRQQVAVLNRNSRSRVRLRNIDRLILVWLYRFFPSILNAIVIGKPETVIRWHRLPPSQGWKAFLCNHVAGIASIDLFVVRTISFRLLYSIVILRYARRRLVAVSVTSNPSAEWIAGQVSDAFPWDQAPQHLIRDRDAALGPAYTRRIRTMGIRDHLTAPRSPWQNGHVERVIGSIRRECLDHVVVFGEAHLRRVLKTYASYYNKVRTHLSLDKNAPDFRRPVPVGDIAAIPILGGLHHQYVRH